ncbi:O-antigen ligase family protein [Pseudanabaena sp. FACHB-2040]|uniref:O-antigen ligase family protein n=1 Tax=Pseudanabaena sp. FACHB-2040 TaxID=2692859 RepID=UPI00168565E4|nr:O-antigen ligase family protein [Pseudanabaena sp. FACHB-2040]MBD2260799.1 O-antigen ligase family protein [Pseudanabaena sp. FACHB-2040]
MPISVSQFSFKLSAWPSLLWGLGGLVVAVLVLFTWLPSSYYRMVEWPWIVIWQAGFWLAGLLLIGWLRRFKQAFQPLGYGLDAVLAATLGSVVLSGLASEFRPVALWNLTLVLGYGLLLYLGRQALNQAVLTRQKIWLGLVIVAAGTAAISLSLWRPDPAMWAAGNFATALRNPQPLGHHNFVGGYLALVLPLVGAFALAERGRWRGLGVGATVLTGVALYVSGSRGAAGGCLIWAVVTLGWATVTATGRDRWRRLAVGGSLLLLLLAGLLTNPRVQSWFAGLRLGQAGTAVAIADGPTLDRAFMLRLGLNILRDRPFLGVGPGVMGRVSNLYRPIETGEGLDHIQQLHNTPMQLAGELGLLGLALYIAWWVVVGRLWWRLYRLPQMAGYERILLYGIGGSFLAYGVASLTDYQLENIAIASTLTLNLLLLLSLAQRALPSPPELPQRQRRIASLSVLGILGLMIYTWLPFDLALAFGQSGTEAMIQTQFTQAENRWLKASQLAPWDPTFSALASERLLDLVAIMGPSISQSAFQDSLLTFSQQAVQAAPYDVWFNQNLAVLYQSQDLAVAEQFASRSAQLLPRNRNFTYCLLGQIYAAQGQLDRAVAAFTLEALVRPAFLTYPLWAEPDLEGLYPAVVQSTLLEYAALLALPPQSPHYNSTYSQWVLLRWWLGDSIADVDLSRLRPLVQAVLMAESDFDGALEQVEAALASGDPDLGLPLLAAWLEPDKYLGSYLQQANLDPDEAQLIEQNLRQNRRLRDWLTALVGPPPARYRGSLAFAYRNRSANQLEQMLQPLDLLTYTFIEKLDLWPDWPREFAALDQHIEQFRTRTLNLPHPTHNAFQLTPLPEFLSP